MSYTPGPWRWWTSNSWKRLKRDDHGIRSTVLEPFVSSDGHPDLTVSEENMRLIAAAPNLYEALKSCQFGFNHRRCPVCAGWNMGPHGETDMVHTNTCPVGIALMMVEEP